MLIHRYQSIINSIFLFPPTALSQSLPIKKRAYSGMTLRWRMSLLVCLRLGLIKRRSGKSLGDDVIKVVPGMGYVLGTVGVQAPVIDTEPLRVGVVSLHGALDAIQTYLTDAFSPSPLIV